jgi:hypothetical protein
MMVDMPIPHGANAMRAEYPIRILEKSANKKGDLFGKLMEGLFLALGYDSIRLNIHKSGREIDLEGLHRTERRRVIAECKATDKPIGGDDINKFVGSLDAEKKKHADIPTEGYFISIAGFTETAIEQEAEVGNGRVTLLTGHEAVQQLIKGRIIVSEARAMELAGRCAGTAGTELVPDGESRLLAHEAGWLWLIYFARNMLKTHFALVHADGQLLDSHLAAKIINSDRKAGGDLHRLLYLAPTKETNQSEAEIRAARQAYETYLAEQCGEIQMEGLPADEEIGSKRLKLENIFVPLFVRHIPENLHAISESPAVKVPSEVPPLAKNPAAQKQEPVIKNRLPVGSALADRPRLAILGPPGGGKSTLLKRLAVAYASPDRRLLIRDHLPKRSWLPLLVRCRQLEKLAKRPISEILDDIPARAELPSDLQQPLRTLVRRSLRNGEALLLVDGLDEISDEGSRLSFVNQLRTFMSTYPNIGLVLTSREAGFRVIGGALSTHCAHYELAEFDDDDIRKLTHSWHSIVVGDSAKVRKDALRLADSICRTPRVRQLAQNPLLLTTLLLVQRWLGQLPTKRTVLYAKAIEVLLMTWNVEAHQPLDQEEALPQLEFLAMYMMKNGVQRISLRQLTEVLTSARRQMPEALAFARMSVGDFIKRVELRSSLLMVSGHEVEQGTLSPMYEFRHLTFQEYLAARAVAHGHYPDRNVTDDLAKTLHPYLNDHNWREVIPLAAVLAGRDCQPLISDLINSSENYRSEKRAVEPWTHRESDIPLPWLLLANCLSDEIQLQPDLLRVAMRCVVERCDASDLLVRLAESKYAALFEEMARAAFIEGKNLLALGGRFSVTLEKELGFKDVCALNSATTDQIQKLLLGPDSWSVACGCLAVMQIAFVRSRPEEVASRRPTKSRSTRLAKARSADMKTLERWLRQILPLTKSEEEIVQFSANWAFVWLAETTRWDPSATPGVLADFASIWRGAAEKPWGYIPAWILTSLPLVAREMRPIANPSPDLIQFIEMQAAASTLYQKWAALILAYYLTAPWDDKELASRVSSKPEKAWAPKCRDRLLKALAGGIPSTAGGPADKS